MTGRLTGDGAPRDSAGSPWRGRTLSGTGFDADAGAGDPAVLHALAVRADDPSVEHDRELMRQVAAARWLVPIVAAPTALEDLGALDVETSTDLAVVILTSPDGRRALPIFTGAAALATWDPAARPLPVTADRAAQAAVAEGCDVIVIDVGAAEPTELRPSMVWALSQRREWAPAHLDPVVAQSISNAIASEASVAQHRVEDGDPACSGVLTVVLGLVPGLGQDEVQALASRIAERLATDGEFRARVDELTFALSPADGT